MYQIRVRDGAYSAKFDDISNKIVITIDATEFMDSIATDEELTDVLLVFNDKEQEHEQIYRRRAVNAQIA